VTDIPTEIDRALEGFLAMVRADPELAGEFERSTTEFFRGAPPGGDARAVLLEAHRHVEWFVLERHSPSLTAGEACEQWAWRAGSDGGGALLASFAGMLRSVGHARRAWCLRLLRHSRYVVAEPEVAHAARWGPDRGATLSDRDDLT
jgi:hypothetical protein